MSATIVARCSRRFAFEPPGAETDPSGLPPVEVGGPDVYPIHAATGHAYGTGFAGGVIEIRTQNLGR